MGEVDELSAVYANFMLSPRHGPDVCEICFNLTDGHRCCYACARGQQWLDGFVPISYSIFGEQLHHALACYKRLTGTVAARLGAELAAVLGRHLAAHEVCLAEAAGVRGRFELVTTVPSGTRNRDQRQPLERVAELTGATDGRRVRLLERSAFPCRAHVFDLHRYTVRQRLGGESVLLIDDTWTTGANAQSAAATLKRGGAGRVAAVVIGRYVTRDWRGNDRHLQALQSPFDWSSCPLCAGGQLCERVAAADAPSAKQDQPVEPAHGREPHAGRE